MKTFDLPSNSNYGDQPIPIAFPDNWDVHISKIHGYDTPALTEAQIAEKIHAAIGAKPISEGAAGKKSVAFSLELRADDRTLTDEDSTGVVDRVLKALKEEKDVTLR